MSIVAVAPALSGGQPALAQDDARNGESRVADEQGEERPLVLPNRWREDWSAFADPQMWSRPTDRLKYLPLAASGDGASASIGLNLREIFEISDAPAFGTSAANPSDAYWLQRAQVHVDLRLGDNWQVFAQMEDVRAFDKTIVGPTDANETDLRLAFVAYSRSSPLGTFRTRIGRQDFEFDLERFLSSRDGPNVRQSFDAAWMGWETDAWRVYALISRPVDYRSERAFDDRPSAAVRFSGLRLERTLSDTMQLSGYYARYHNRAGRGGGIVGAEDRHILDLRIAGSAPGLEWDVEAMVQAGTLSDSSISAWGVGARVNRKFATAASPTVGLQFDAASGDGDPEDDEVQSFNPLFPNGFYFSLGGHTGYTNLFHLKPSLSLKPEEAVTVTAGIGMIWRQTTNDAVYVLPSLAVPGTAGQGRAWTGAYAQLRAEYRFARDLIGSVEFVHYDAGGSLRLAGGSDSRHLRTELKYAW